MLTAVFAGCGSNNKATVTTDGSTSMSKVIGALAEAFYEDSGINVTYNATGSGTGIQAVQEGVTSDFQVVILKMKKKSGPEATFIAYDGIAIIVNPPKPCK